MVDVDAKTTVVQGVTFVLATVTNTRGTAQVIKIESRLDGPTWYPRHGDVTASEWDEDTWESVLHPGESRGVGFGSPAEPRDPPMRLVDVRRATPADFDRDTQSVLRDLAAWRPPRDIVRNPQ
ncbi:conserved hypothetical protein [Halorhabdus utahensis DSM 12940]|uniref:Uncharacterized protein n=1 Tax=Halorhabdus utahensis (strain DSM 12940 / JCM 11049 / AX-2) TaxID=519442 RepID=C7NPV1_HALUD|nr:conserved hypothetical protein [Halorhabdus utahensis DSM 12940]